VKVLRKTVLILDITAFFNFFAVYFGRYIPTFQTNLFFH
jgi:hypothetical protein